MSDDEVMRFEITDDDLNNEFNYDMKRPRMSKNQVGRNSVKKFWD
jgi:hypothetical protein